MKILVIKPSSLGDIVHGLQVIAIIRKHVKNLTVDWVVRDCFSEIVSASSIVDNIFLFERHGGFFKFCNLLSHIRQFRYDVVLDMQGLARSGIMTLFSRANRKIGRKDSRELSGLAYGEKICLPVNKPYHAMDILLKFLPMFGLSVKFEHVLNFSFKDEGGLVEKYKNLTNGNILLFPESRRPEKQWPFFYELAGELAKKYDEMNVTIIGQRRSEQIFSQPNIFNLTGQTTMVDVLFLIKNCDLLVANDSAPIHIGAAMQKKIIALFGPTNPLKFGPYPVKCKRHRTICCDDLLNLSVEKVVRIASIEVDSMLNSCTVD